MSKLSDKIGQFTTIPNSVIAMWPVIGLDAMALFLYLRYRTNSQSEIAFPSYDTIHSDTGLTRRRIAIAIRTLEKYGLVERKRRFSGSTIYTLKMPDFISKDAGLMEMPISKDAGLPLVQGVHTNKTDINKTEKELPNAVSFKTRDIQKAYESCVPYKIDWIKGEGSAAKWLAEAGYTPNDIQQCYAALKLQPFWKDKPLSLTSLKKQIGEWKQGNHQSSEKVLEFTA